MYKAGAQRADLYHSDDKVVLMDRSRDHNESIVDGSAGRCIWLPLITVTEIIEFGPEPGTHATCYIGLH